MKTDRSDASTSTDDIKGRPLCLFYFTHPFGVLSPEPPRLAAAPPHVARAFLNMEPISPFHFWSTSASSDESYNTATSESSKPDYDLGQATVHSNPVNVVSVARTKKCTIEYESRRDTLSSSLLSSDIWLNSSSSCRSDELKRRLIPYHKILPPLRLPLPYPKYAALESPDDMWPKKCLNPAKFSLPPIEMPPSEAKPVARRRRSRVLTEDTSSAASFDVREAKSKRALAPGVNKQKHLRKPRSVRRTIVSLMRRAIRVFVAALATLLWSLRLRLILYTSRDSRCGPQTTDHRPQTTDHRPQTTERQHRDDLCLGNRFESVCN